MAPKVKKAKVKAEIVEGSDGEEEVKVKKGSKVKKAGEEGGSSRSKKEKSKEGSSHKEEGGSSRSKKEKSKEDGSHKEEGSSKSSKSSGKKKSSTKHVAGHQANLLYAMVTRGKVVLVHHTPFTGNFADVALKCLEELPHNNNRFSLNHRDYVLNFLIENGITYAVVCDKNVPNETAFGFLGRVKDDFSIRLGKKAAQAAAYGLQKEFGSRLSEHMQYITEHPEEVNKFSKIKTQVAEVKGVMKQNIEKALQRGEKLETLQTKTDMMKSQAQLFQKQGDQIKQKMWFENMKVKLIIFSGFIVLGLVAYVSLFGSPFS